MRFLGLDIELGPEEGTWLVHQPSYIYAFLQDDVAGCYSSLVSSTGHLF